MLVEFTIKNFRSIKDEQIFSMYAENKHKHHAGHISFIEDDIGVLKTSAIFGANASGKTTLVLAIEALQKLAVESGNWKDGDEIKCYEPYLLSAETKSQPSEFEIEFYVENVRYNYKIHFSRQEIIFEKLDFYPNSRPANLFTRQSSSDWKSVKFGEHYKGGKKQIAFFANNTYLSKAGNSADSPEIIQKIFSFFRKGIITLLVNQSISISDWDKDGYNLSVMNAFLQEVDLGIKKFDIEYSDDVPKIPFPETIPEAVQEKIRQELSRKTIFYHESSEGGLVKLDSENESMGTNKLFKLLPSLINVLKNGRTLFIDEIESSLHPHIAELIVKIFNDPIVNKNNAQLIFTTHNLSLMNSKMLRKDQVYLVSKTAQDGTILTCLEEYDDSLKDTSPFAKWYDEGRLGGVPSINYQNIVTAINEVD